MFNDTIGKLMYGEAYDTVRKIKNIEENGGYNVYYRVEKSTISNNEYVEYDLQMAKNAMEKEIITQFDREIFNQLVEREYKFESLLRKYDYNKRAIVENSKCTVILLAIFKEIAENISGKPMWSVGDMLEAFTCERESEVANGRYVSFTELNYYMKHLVETCNVNDKFYNSSMDYIMTVILKYNL
jgi:hypothetical protein